MLAEPQRDKQTLQRQGDVELKILKSKNAVETEPRKRQNRALLPQKLPLRQQNIADNVYQAGLL